MCVDSLAALRTVTVGIQNQEMPNRELPARSYPCTFLPSLSQVHFGVGVPTNELFFSELNVPLPNMQELTLAPSDLTHVTKALHACQNLSRLNLYMSPCSTRISAARLKEFADSAVAVRTICLLDISHILDELVLKSFDDARFRSITLDYRGHPCVPGSTWNPSLPSPSNALTDDVHLEVRLRENVYEVDVVDCVERRRKILIERDTILLAPGFSDCYVNNKTVLSAMVDALAWDYFVAGLPDTPYNLPDLTILVQRETAELDNVSLARLSGLRNLCIAVSRSGVRFGTQTLCTLVQSFEGKLAVLSIPSNAHFDDLASSLSLMACTLVHY